MVCHLQAIACWLAIDIGLAVIYLAHNGRNVRVESMSAVKTTLSQRCLVLFKVNYGTRHLSNFYAPNSATCLCRLTSPLRCSFRSVISN